MNNGINYIDLFSGIGGFAKGIENAGIKIKNHYYSEIDEHCIEIYKKHFPKNFSRKQIRKEHIASLLKNVVSDMVLCDLWRCFLLVCFFLSP